MLCVKPEFRRRQKRIFFSVLISRLKIQKISPEKSGLLKTVFSNTVCNCSEKFNMFQLIIFFHKIRIGTCFNYDYLFCRVNIYPLSVHTDSHKLLLVSFPVSTTDSRILFHYKRHYLLRVWSIPHLCPCFLQSTPC